MKTFFSTLWKKSTAALMALSLILSTVPAVSALGVFSVSFNASTAANFPAGTNITFSITGAANAPNQNNTYSDNFFPDGVSTITAQLPANTQFGNGAGYNVTGANTATVNMTSGATLNVVINIVDTPGAPAPAPSSTVNLSFNASTAANFPVGTNITFGITGVTNVPNQNNTYSDNMFPVGTATVTAQLPANTQFGNGAGYTVTGTNTLNFTTTNGGNHTLVFNVIDIAGGGGGGGAGGTANVSLSFDASTATNFPAGTNITFSLTGAANVANQNNTYSDTMFPAGTTTMSATLPANTQLGNGVGYTVTGANTANFTITNGVPANIVFQVIDGAGGGGGGGGGGGTPTGPGRRRIETPIITFTRNGQEIASLNLPRGEDANVTVTAEDERGGITTLDMTIDPTDSGNPASFNISNAATATPSGLLNWTPNTNDSGTFNFIFQAKSGFYTEATLPITVIETVNPGATVGGGTNITGGGTPEEVETPTIEERVETCSYSDNNTESVVYLCLLGIIDPPNDEAMYDGGTKQRRYFGRDHITRAAFTKIMVNITYDESTIDRVKELVIKNTFYAFPDVEPIAWFSRFITVAKLDDHVHGYPHIGLFVPWNDIEISEAVKILFNVARHDNSKIQRDLDVAAADVGADAPWFMKFAALAYKYGGYTPNLEGKDPGTIYSKQLSRQQAADVIYTTIQNAGIEPKSHVSDLKVELNSVQKEIEDAELDLHLDPVQG